MLIKEDNFLNQEFSTDGKGDYRSPSIQVVNPDGSRIFSGKVKDHRIFPGKYTLSVIELPFNSDEHIDNR